VKSKKRRPFARQYSAGYLKAKALDRSPASARQIRTTPKTPKTPKTAKTPKTPPRAASRKIPPKTQVRSVPKIPPKKPPKTPPRARPKIPLRVPPVVPKKPRAGAGKKVGLKALNKPRAGVGKAGLKSLNKPRAGVGKAGLKSLNKPRAGVRKAGLKSLNNRPGAGQSRRQPGRDKELQNMRKKNMRLFGKVKELEKCVSKGTEEKSKLTAEFTTKLDLLERNLRMSQERVTEVGSVYFMMLLIFKKKK